MKCKNCGGEIGRTQAFCYYCGSENTEAYLHQQKVEAKKKRNEKLKHNVLERNGVTIVNKAMTFVLLGSIVFFIISVVVSFMKFDEEEHNEIDYEKAEELYEAGEYGKLQSYIFDCDYHNEENNKYLQAVEFYKAYMVFIEYRNRYIESMQNRDGNEEYSIESMASYIVTISNPLNDWSNEEALGNNQELFDECRKDAEDFLRAYFEFSDEDIEGLKVSDEKTSYDIEDELEEKMKAIYYREKGYEDNE